MSQNLMSVSSLNTKIKSLLEATFMHTMVEGEVASATYHTSGHLYFSIKDKDSSIKCVMWRSSVAKMKFRIEKGMHIVVEGSVSVYTPRGEYQFQTVRIEPYGQGALALAFEQLKKKLKSQGYFDIERKKTIPNKLQKIALVTAKESAALYDMLKIIEKRWAMLEIIIVDTLVQGEAAGVQIARSLEYADTLGVDVVIVGRGGGSAEDLWAFNEEIVANAIYNMQTPIVSAIGHEVDVVISDFVADLRAPTPSAAIEMILPDSQDMLYVLNEMSERFIYTVKQKIQQSTRDVQHNKEIFLRSSPSMKLIDINNKFIQYRVDFEHIKNYIMERFIVQIPNLKHNYTQAIFLRMQEKEQRLSLIEEKLKMNNPKLQCQQGWAQVSSAGKTVSLDNLKVGEAFILEDASVQVEALCVNKKVT